jgi:hypothetical protein
MSRSIAVIFALLIAASAAGQEAELRDALLEPLPIRDLYLLGNGFYSFEPESPRVLDIGEWRVDVHHAEAATFTKSNWISISVGANAPTQRVDPLKELQDPRYQNRDALFLVHGMTHRTTFGIRRGLGSHVEVGVAIPVTRIDGGWSDAIVESVHHGLGLGNAGRNGFVQNVEAIYVRTPGVLYVRDHSAGYAIGDIALTGKYELARLEDQKLSLAVTGSVELPTGNADTLDGSGSIDAGARLIATRKLGGGDLTGSFGVIRLGRNKPLGLKSQLLVTSSLAYSHTVTSRTALALQLTVSETPFRQYHFPELNRRSYMLAIGAQHAMHGLVFHAAFIENVVVFENSADAGLQWGISKRF